MFRKRNTRKRRVEALAGFWRVGVVSWPPQDPEPGAAPDEPSTGADRATVGRFAEAVATEEQLLVGVEARVEEEREKLARFMELFERRHAMYEEQAELRRERVLTERRIRALEAREERERRRAERRVVSADGSRRGRPVRVEVDDGAWAVLKLEALHRRVWLVWWVGELVRVEVDSLAAGSESGPPSSRRRRSPGEGDPVLRRRFLRVDVDDDRWAALRAAATEAGLTVGRYVGELAEAAAYEVGWRCAASPDSRS